MEILQYIWPVVAMIAALIESIFDAKGEVKEHAISASVRVAVAFAISWFMFTPYYAFVYSTILLVCYWVVFDICYNIFKSVGVWYIGNTSLLDRLARKMFKKEGGFNYMAFKLFCIVLLLMLFSL